MRQDRLPVVVDGLRLRGGAWVPDEPRGIAVLLHGIPSSAPPDPDDLGYPGLARTFAERGWAAAWADMRAARSSPGYFSIEGWVRDARAIVDAARSLQGVGGLPLALIGSSAGGAVSVEAAARGAPVDALVLLAAPAAWVSFADVPQAGVVRIQEEAGMSLHPEVVADPTSWAAEFTSVVAENAISKVKVPIMIVHGTADDVVPVNHADRLANRAPKAELRVVEGAGHQLRREPKVIDAVLAWLESHL